MSPVTSTTTNCPGCGAALNADYTPGQITYASCPYCKTRVAVTAPGPAAPAPAAADPARIRRGVLVLAVAGAFIVIGTAVAVMLARRSALKEKIVMSEFVAPETADRSTTIVCFGDRRMVLDNEKILKDQTAVVTAGRCNLTIKNTSLKSSSTALVVSGDSVVTIDNSLVSGESTAIIASGRARVRIVRSTVKSGNTGLISSGSAEVDLDRSVLQGSGSAYIQNGEGRIIMKDTKVQGRRVGKAETR